MLEVLLAAEGQVVSTEELVERVWDENTDPFTNALKVAIMTLRRKLGEPPIIDTIQGVGYRVQETAAARSANVASEKASGPERPRDSPSGFA